MLNSSLNVRQLRRDVRTPYHAPATLIVDGRSWEVVVINYSKRGICIRGSFDDLIGHEATLKLCEPPISLQFQIMWMRGGAVGMQVAPDVDPGRVAVFYSGLLAPKTNSLPFESPSNFRFGLFMGDCPAMQSVFKRIERAASTAAPVFITGETGTGKELCALAIHRASSRKEMPFVAVNCATLTGQFLGSDLFGHRRGSFTGATTDRIGAVEQADEGTLFLDEFGEFDLSEQSKLLRFAQSGEFMRLGDERPRHSGARIICATNRNPKEEVRSGQLREDLFYRLHVIPIHMPPLRERKQDILRLSRHFLRSHASECGRPSICFTEGAEDWLLRYTWPGNIRQLSNAIRQCTVLLDGDTITRFDIENAASALDDPIASNMEECSLFPADDRIAKLDDVIELAIERAVSKMGGSIPKAALALGVSSSTIYRHYKDLSSKKARA